MSRKEKLEESIFWQGLILGLVMGIVGNLLVSYLMKVLEYLNEPWYVYLASLIGILIGVAFLVWIMWKRVKELTDN
jgi:uncharacterized membrane protein YeaQ/YmgE (transglycosylase-associated protein family)